MGYSFFYIFFVEPIQNIEKVLKNVCNDQKQMLISFMKCGLHCFLAYVLATEDRPKSN